MAISFNLSGLGFASITIGVTTTTIPLLGFAYSPNVGKEPFRSGGDLNPSMIRRAGGRPGFRLTMPMDTAWTILGQFLPIQVAAFTAYQAMFTGTPALRTGTGAATLALTATTGVGIARITRIYPMGQPVPMMVAEVVILLGSTDGLTNPITAGTGSLPSLGSNPTLHTMGPLVDNATTRWGDLSWSLDTGMDLEPIQTDGLYYPTSYRLGAIQAAITLSHVDTVALYTALGDDGKDGTGAGFLVYARAYSAASKSLLTTGYSFTMAKGMAALDQIGADGTDKSEAAVVVTSYAAAGSLTYPIAVATSATLPT